MMPPDTEVQPDPRAYVRIAGMLREMIHGQVLPAGSRAPTITRLCREHGHASCPVGTLTGCGLLCRLSGNSAGSAGIAGGACRCWGGC